ncbi:cytochrome b/b6 domain-containing protein [Streptomyces sp. DR7-3]|uniref:cytochrome b/b6 domain-containing protein n=1 Tax=Streptomyces malaysiensis TaxID=92644 RepID=UPI0020449C05|nr:cytochrome b/b6 domain-containing protein [Streptomyces sp. DR7-3]MCM3810037.1 cytochrome b/b6 domain-containing protein [Streptomyces sp. DR7-3]
MTPPPERTVPPRPRAGGRDGSRVPRFSPAERWVHRTTALLLGMCVFSAGCLYLPALAELVGRRALVVTIHEWTGILTPVPALLGLASRAFRADLTRINRFGPQDRVWLRAALRRDHRRQERPAGKFNAGQKLYASYIAGAVLVMAGTGLLMWFTGLAPLVWRTSATFVHDWLALAVVAVLIGHIGKAFADPEARRGMRTGRVEREWAAREHPLWRPDEDHGDGREDGRGDGHGDGPGDGHADAEHQIGGHERRVR